MFMKCMSVKCQQQGVKAESRFDDIVKHKIHDKNIFWKENSDKFFRYKNKIGKVSLNISKLELLELKKSLVNIISKEIKFLQFNTNEYNMDK